MILMKWGKNSALLLTVFALLVGIVSPLVVSRVSAQDQDRDFSLQVTPSPIVETLQPGKTKTIELRVNNQGSKAEDLRAQLRTFSVNNGDGEVSLGTSAPNEVVDWVEIQNPLFSVKPGEWYTQKITVNPPEDAGFSYSFAIVINRANPPKPQPGQRAIEGSVAVFTLLSVDKPGAKRQFDVLEFASKHRVYEYLPSELSFKVKNTGNTIIQPLGNIFIQRNSNDSTPISTIPLNDKRSYLLPGVTRELTANWSDGFPVFRTVTGPANVEPERKLEWNWSDASKFRFGKYTAKMVAVYNDGTRDVPISTEVSFWVIPWKLLLIVFLVLLVVGFGFFSAGRQLVGSRKKKPAKSSDRDRGERT